MEIFELACRERVGNGDDNLGHVILVLLAGAVLILGKFLIVFLNGFVEIETVGLTVDDAFLVGVVVLLLVLVMFILSLMLALAACVVAMLVLVASIISIPVAVSIFGTVT